MIRLLPILLCLPAHALVSTNSDAITTVPSPVGWDVTGLSGEGCAISTNVFVTVAHQPFRNLDWPDGKNRNVLREVIPPGIDLRFTIVDFPFVRWAPVFTPTNEWPDIPVVIIGGGVGAGRNDGGTNFYWGAESSRVKRWGTSGRCQLVTPLHYYLFRQDNCGAASGDSGGAVFTLDGSFVGPIQFGADPMTLGEQNSGGPIAWQYVHLVKEYMPGAPVTPATPPKPVAVTKLTVERK